MRIKSVLAVATMVSAMALAPAVNAEHTGAREHRALWLSPYVNYNWPSAPLTTASAVESQTTIIANRMKKFKDQNINVIYFHCRAYCDALYKSSYEPWSAKVAGERGGEPVADAFEIIIREAHKQGIEVYAWLNPYRYSENTSQGSSPLNYENSHPDWLIKNSRQTVLNPGLEVVKQRIVDVISEIVRNYDVDGVLYDDYFYPQGGMSEGSDADDYELWKSSKTSLSIGDWRRANIDEMVARVNKAIKEIKPYVPFGIAPAGVSSPENIQSRYGLEPINGDWQYAQIYSNPVEWVASGTIDFISPQIYWPSRYNELCTWWNTATQKYNRHLYPSVDITSIKSGQTEEYIREALYTRETTARDAGGFVFFHYGTFINFYEKLYEKSLSFGDNFARGAFTAKALTPLRPWANKREARTVTSLSRSGNTLNWDNIEGMRYTVYAVPEGMEATFAGEREYLDGVTYTNSYDIPTAKASGYSFAVAVYDRYGNEYSPVFVGHSVKTVAAPTLTYPTGGIEAGFMFDFTWKGEGTRYVVELADEPTFANTLAMFETNTKSCALADMPKLTDGKTYYWRVRTGGPDITEAVSTVESFIPSNIKITKPTDGQTFKQGDRVRIECQQASKGTTYTFTISEKADMSNPIVTSERDYEHNWIYPNDDDEQIVLHSGCRYYCQVKAVNGTATSTSAVVSFVVEDVDNIAAPQFVFPSASAEKVYSNEKFIANGDRALKTITVTLSASNTFPSRSSKVYTSDANKGYFCETADMGEIKIGSKALVDGQTYYIKAQGTYTLLDGTTKKTDITTRSFVYSSELGVSDITGDDNATSWVDAEGVLHLGGDARHITVYSLTGATIADSDVTGTESNILCDLESGVYLVRITGTVTQTLKVTR